MDWLCKLSQSTPLDPVPSILEVHDCGSGNSRMAREVLIRKTPSLASGCDLDTSDRPPFVLVPSLVRRIQCSCFGHHGRIDSAWPARRCLFADVMKLIRDNVPARWQADSSACTWFAVRSANLLSALDRTRLISSSIVLRDSQPGGFGNFGEFLP